MATNLGLDWQHVLSNALFRLDVIDHAAAWPSKPALNQTLPSASIVAELRTRLPHIESTTLKIQAKGVIDILNLVVAYNSFMVLHKLPLLGQDAPSIGRTCQKNRGSVGETSAEFSTTFAYSASARTPAPVLNSRMLLEATDSPAIPKIRSLVIAEHFDYKCYDESVGEVMPADTYFDRPSTIIQLRERIKRQVTKIEP